MSGTEGRPGACGWGPALAAALLACLLAAPAAGGEGRAPAKPEVRKALDRSLAWLDKNLRKLPDVEGTPRKQFTYAVAGLVFLMGEKTRSGGAGAGVVDDVRAYLSRYVRRVASRSRDPEQLPAKHGQFSSKELNQYTWPLAQAGIFFSELYLRGRNKGEAKRVLGEIVRLLREAQESNGGWGHGRVRSPATAPATGGERPGRIVLGGYPSTLLASSNCVATSLGIIEATLGRGTVEGLDRARRYYRTAQLPNGNFPYDPSQRSSGRSMNGVSRTGGALMAMHFLGVPHRDEGLRRSLAFLQQRLDYASEGHGSATLNLMHCAVALRALDDLGFERFRALYFLRILERQTEEGDFLCACEGKAFGTSCDGPQENFKSLFPEGGKAYITALHSFILLLDEGRLEILRKKPVPAPQRSEATERPRRRR